MSPWLYKPENNVGMQGAQGLVALHFSADICDKNKGIPLLAVLFSF